MERLEHLEDLGLADLLKEELAQRRSSGFDVSDVEAQIESMLVDPRALDDETFERSMQALERTAARADWPYDEPSTFPEIVSTLGGPTVPGPFPTEVDVRDRLRAAWAGRCAGCILGKPVEGWTREQIHRYLSSAGAYPLEDFVPFLDQAPDAPALNGSWTDSTRGRITCVARDDDIDYTILALHILETHGSRFSTEDVAAEWLDHLPFLQTFTAERIAYRNLTVGLRPPRTATWRNPYREWIGAQIRADLWGYVSPGDPMQAAEMAFTDASLSHIGNGIYGAMWVAALIAISFVAPDAPTALEMSLAYVPPRSRLHEALRSVVGIHARGVDWEQARDQIEDGVGAYHWTHVINNATVVAAALLWGDGDYSRTVGLAVGGGWDSDCNGATAGSVFGALHGMSSIPLRWIEPLRDLVRSSIVGFDGSSITDLAERTLALTATDQSRSVRPAGEQRR